MSGHPKLHKTEHHKDGIDELIAELLATNSTTLNQLLGADGEGGLEIKTRYAEQILNVYRTAGVRFPNNDTGYVHIGGAGAITGTEAFAQVQMPKCRVKSIRGRCTGGSGTFTLRKNGVNTDITGTVATANYFFEIDDDELVEFADKDKLSIAYSSGINWVIRGIQIIYETVVK